MAIFNWTDGLAAAIFIVGWLGYTWLTDASPLRQRGLTHLMSEQRRRWMHVMLQRDFRMIDTAIMGGLQQGTAFFASACIFAIGGCFALLGSVDRIAAISADLPFYGMIDRSVIETKLLGLVAVFSFSFFKFGWAYRLFNYCTILMGAVPMLSEARRHPVVAERAVRRAVAMNQQAGQHFNAGLRAIFFGIAYLGWFLGPFVLIATTLFVIAILANRQFFSPARAMLQLDAGDADADAMLAETLVERDAPKVGF